MKREDEIFRKLDKEKPLIKRKDNEPVRPQRRSIGRIDDAAAPSVSAQERTRRSGGEAQPSARQRARYTGQEAPARASVREEAQVSSRRTRYAEKEAAPAPIRERSREGGATQRSAPAPERQHKTEPARRPESAPVQRTRTAAQTTQEPDRPRREQAHQSAEAGSSLSRRPRTEASAPARTSVIKNGVLQQQSGIMPPISLKDPADFALPAKLTPDDRQRPAPPMRHELKYYLNYGDYVILRQKMKGLLRTDEHAGENGSYFIRSLYFDDIYNSAVFEKQAGVMTRHKYRIRIYDLDKGFIRFEKKIKNGQFISKESFPMSYAEYCAFTAGDIEFLLHKPQPLAKEVYLSIRQSRLKPCVVVDYDREPFVMNFETVRITFDRDIRTGKPSWDIFDPALPVMPLLEKGVAVMEVKFGRSLPDYLLNVIHSADALQRSAVSKYIICRQYD